jgi:serine/threonine-protein kinase RsbW
MRSLVSEPGGDAAASSLEWTIASDIREIDPIVLAVTGLCEAAGFPSKACRLNVPVALTEAIVNAIERGNDGDVSRTVRVTACIDDATLCVEVTDEGNGFDVDEARALCSAPDWIEREDGRGVFLMYALMDHVETRRDAGHTVRLVLRRT